MFLFIFYAIISLLNRQRTYHLAHYEWIQMCQLMMLTMSINSMMIDVWINHQSGQFEDLWMHPQCTILLHKCMISINIIRNFTYWFQYLNGQTDFDWWLDRVNRAIRWLCYPSINICIHLQNSLFPFQWLLFAGYFCYWNWWK